MQLNIYVLAIRNFSIYIINFCGTNFLILFKWFHDYGYLYIKILVYINKTLYFLTFICRIISNSIVSSN